jgi:hypothetical protein
MSNVAKNLREQKETKYLDFVVPVQLILLFDLV